MIVKECWSSSGMCPCLKCEEYCCVEDEEVVDTEKLCKTAREYCESVNGKHNMRKKVE